MRDRLIRAALRAVPPAIGQHILFVLRSTPSLSERFEHHIRPIHFYEPIPDYRELTPADFERRREPAATNFDMPAQRALMLRLGASYGGELQTLAETGAYPFRNGYFDGLDAGAYYALIRDLKPRRIIEIGSGYSTRVADLARARNVAEGAPAEIVCIEPYPASRLSNAGLDVTLIQQRVERVPLATFESLEPNDILFIDSSHAIRFGGDVCHEFLQVLPRLPRGVWVHVHDIFLPYDYPAKWLLELRYAWNEQYLLEAFLAFNAAFAPTVALHWLWRDSFDEWRAAWPAAVISNGGPQGPASFWMTRHG